MSVRKAPLLSLMGIILLFASLSSGCSSTETFAPPPYLPAEYYNCIDTNPTDLINAYFAGYGEIWGPMQAYNDKVFVFKNVLIDGWVVRELDKGWLWLDLIKCHLADPDEMTYFKEGDRIDVVGLNLGPEDTKKRELTFIDCYILPSGLVALPPEGGNGAILPGY